MYNFKIKDKSQILINRIIYSPIFLILLFIIFLIFLTSTIKIYFQSKKIYLERKEKELALKIEEEKNKELQRKIGELDTSEGVEKNLREKLQIKKPGEEVAVIYTPKSSNNPENENIEQNFFKKILNPVRNLISNGASWWMGK